MPTYNMVCPECGWEQMRLCPVPISRATDEQLTKLKFCPDCEEPFMIRQPQGPTATVKETLDNGAMRRKVERFKDAERLYKERAKGGPK